MLEKLDAKTLVWLIILTIAITFPIIFVKKYVHTKNMCYIIIAIIIYVIAVIGYSVVLQKFPVYYMYPVWFISMIIVLFSGVLFFGEKMKMINVVGVVLGLFSMYLVIK